MVQVDIQTDVKQLLIKTMIVDDHALFRTGLGSLLNQKSYSGHIFDVIGESIDGTNCLQECIRLRPDVILMDVDMPVMNGEILTQEIQYHQPSAKIVALTAKLDADTISKMIHVGARGYISKTTDLPELVQGIVAVFQNEIFLSTEVKKILESTEEINMHDSDTKVTKSPELILTKRERNILRLIAEEKGNQEIADLLFISPRTVEAHKRNILIKLKMKNVAGLMKYYIGHSQR